MKKCKKVLALVLALIMLVSTMSVMASAVSAKDTYIGSSLSGKMNAADSYELTDTQYASCILDFADKSLAEANIPKMTMSITAGLTIAIDATSINGLNNTIVNLAPKLDSFSSFLGDLGDLNLSYFSANTARDGSGARDVAFITALVNLLKDSTNASAIAKIVKGGFDEDNGGLDAGLVGNFLPSSVTDVVNDIVGFLKETLFGSKTASFDTEISTLITDLIDSLNLEMLADFTFSSSDSVYLILDKLVRSLVNWAVQQLQLQKTSPEDSAFGDIKELILTMLPTFEEDFPFVKLDNIGDITWNWSDAGAGTQYVAGTKSTYIVYYINDMLGTIINTVVPDFADASNPNYTGGWTMDHSTGSFTTLDSNIQKAAKFVDLVINGGSLTAEEESQSSNLTKSYAMVLANYVIGLYLPGLKVEKEDIIEGNIGTLAVQALNEFLCYYIPEAALDDLYTYDVNGTVLNRTKYTESYCLSIYKSLGAQIIAKFCSGYFPFTFSDTSDFDAVLKDLAAYFVNTVAKAGSTSEGALGTISSSETVYAAVDRIIFSLNTSGTYVEGASSSGKRNVTGILPKGFLPAKYNTSKKVVDHIFDCVENLSIGGLLEFFVPNETSTGTEMASTSAISLVCYELIRIINVLFPGTWTSKTGSLDTLITNSNLSTIVKSILTNLDMNYHIYPALRAVSTLLGISTKQSRGEAEASLAKAVTIDGSVAYSPIDPVITTSSTTIPSDTYYIKVDNTSAGINGGYHNASSAEIQDTPYKLRVSSIVCENDSKVTISGVSSSGTIIDSDSSAGFAVGGSLTSSNEILSILVTYAMSDETGRRYSEEQQYRLYLFAGQQYTTSTLTSQTVKVTVPTKVYGSVDMFNDAVGSYYTTDASATYSASAEDTVFPSALVTAGITFKASDPGKPSSTDATTFNPWSASTKLKSAAIAELAGSYTINYKIKTKDTSADSPTYGSNQTTNVTWVLFDDGGLYSAVKSYEAMTLQSGAFSSSTLWDAFTSELVKSELMIKYPQSAGTTASVLTSKFVAQLKALNQAYENLLETQTSSGLSLLKERLDQYDGNAAENIRAAYTMWDYTPVSWARYSDSLSTVKSNYNNNESSSITINETLRYNQVMSTRLFTSTETDNSKANALSNLQDVRSSFSAENYDATKYTPESYTDLIDALDQADTVLAGTAISGTGEPKTSDYADARADILSSLNKLTEQPLDVNALYQDYQNDTELYNDNMYYTDEAWDNYLAARENAETAINDPYSLLPADYTDEDIVAANAIVEQYRTELAEAVQGLIDNPYVSSLITNSTTITVNNIEISGRRVFDNAVLHAGKYVFEVDNTLLVPYGMKGNQVASYFTMSANESRYQTDEDGNPLTYSSAGTSTTFACYQDATLARTVTSANLKTGNVVQVTDGNGNKTVYTIVVIGNNGTTVIKNSFSSPTKSTVPAWLETTIKSILSGTGSSLTAEEVLSCDLNVDGKIDNTDLVLLKMYKTSVANSGTDAEAYYPPYMGTMLQ